MLIRYKLLFSALAGLLLLAFYPFAVSAAPPRPGVGTLSQPDGTKFQARVWGDEYSHGLETLDGHTIVLDPQTHYWVYAVLSANGTLTPARGPSGESVVGRSSPAALPRFARPATTVRRPLVSRAPNTSNTGSQPVLVILVQFSDQTSIGTDASYWNSLFFGTTNSVKSFYDDVSYNQLTLTPAAQSYGSDAGVVGWLTLSVTYTQETANIDQLAADAISAADPYVNFASFDTNHDGYISTNELHIAIVAAGYEASYDTTTGCGNEIWAQEGALSDSSAPKLDNVRVGAASHSGGYTVFGEWDCDQSTSPGNPATMGVPTHEMGHDLGLPDLYDTTASPQSQGIGDWSLMAIGVWNQSGAYPGDTPAELDPWCRWFEGWVTPTQVTVPLIGASIPQIETSPTVYQFLPNPNGVDWSESHTGTGEYFLVENREKTDYDKALPGFGLLIWHIDESMPDNNNANHRLVDLEQADGLRNLNLGPPNGNSGDDGDPYGSSGNRTFGPFSNPSSVLYSGKASYVTVRNISNSGSTMSADLVLPYSYFFPLIEKQLH